MFVRETILSGDFLHVVDIGKQDGLVVLPHFFRGHKNITKEMLWNTDFIKVLNGRSSSMQDCRSREMAPSSRKTAIAGRVKRVEILIMLARLLLKEGFKVRTVTVGGGSIRHYCRMLSEPIKDNIIFTGHVPRKQSCDYALLDVFMLPSFSEGLLTVLLEASAAGKLSVAANVNGVSDIIRHEETGFLVGRNECVNSYYHWVSMVLSDEEMRKRMDRNALEYVKSNFSWSSVVSQYEKIHEQLSHQHQKTVQS